LSLELPCIGAAPRCNNCATDTGNWWGDCLSCGLGFFRQYDAGTCLDLCPTGSIASLITNECENPGLGFISNIVFNKLGILYRGLPFGIYRLQPGDVFGHFAPINTLDRGLYFDGDSGHLKISGLVLNTNFSLHSWMYFFSFQGQILAIEAEAPTTEEDEQTMTCSCGESSSTTEEADIGINWNGGLSNVSASGKLVLRRWVDVNFITRWNDIDASMDIAFHIGEFQLDISIAGNPFHHKRDTDITFGKNMHAFVLNAKFFNQAIPKADIEGLRFSFDFDFDRPVCLIG
jgi:hypothetical protein